MLTYTGKEVYPVDLRVEDIDIRDIAHALSLACRFGGHIASHYSVAEHSVRVATILPRDLQLWGLLHDATEAYLGDMVRPLKCMMPEYKKVEERAMRVIAARYGMDWPEPPEVKKADNILLATERRDLFPGGRVWRLEESPLTSTITPLSAVHAEELFLDMFDWLSQPHGGVAIVKHLQGAGAILA